VLLLPVKGVEDGRVQVAERLAGTHGNPPPDILLVGQRNFENEHGI